MIGKYKDMAGMSSLVQLILRQAMISIISQPQVRHSYNPVNVRRVIGAKLSPP